MHSPMIAPTAAGWGRIAVAAVVAGLIGAVLLDAFLYVAVAAPQGASLTAMWQHVAVSAAGAQIAGNPLAPWIGLAVHVAVSIGWAGGYAYLAASQPFLNRRWAISGVAYGAVVYLLMQLVMLAGHSFELPSGPDAVGRALIAHCFFFGLPVALVVRALSSRAAP